MSRLRSALESLPPETLVPARWVLEQLDASPTPAEELRDLTVQGVAAQFGRAPSTVRAWCEAGRFPGAFKLRGRDWRIPHTAIEAFRAAQQAGPRRSASRAAADLGTWRRRKTAGDR